jgi:hypothetical protein
MALLRLTPVIDSDHTTRHMEGPLTAGRPGSPRRALEFAIGRIRLDSSGLMRIDPESASMLLGNTRRGVALVSASPYMRRLLDSVPTDDA